MSYILFAVLAGFLLALSKHIGDIFTITDFECINGPLLHVSKEDVHDNNVEIDNTRNKLLSVKFNDSKGTPAFAYFKVPVNLMGVTDMSQLAIIKRSMRRAGIECSKLNDYQFH